ncbi:MAG TPA: UDP-N-acetylglucosamine 2-epimerase [Chitinophagaceae bacterium]|nr:UDP-N-acetylglucosamine 2-epimerase [Chitinophagaceae bacterium]
MNTKIAVVTGTRAEYGLLQPLISLIRDHPLLDLQLIVTGSHLSAAFGKTSRQITQDGFPIKARVDIQVKGESPLDIAASAGIALSGLSRAFGRLKPDWLILLGDRYEILCAAVAAHLAAIPIAHISGGELTQGATDDAFRHAVTKLSYLHFTATETYRNRVIQLGESPSRVFNVGALGIDNIRRLKPSTREELEKELELDLSVPSLLVTFHPVTLDKVPAEKQFRVVLDALETLMPISIILTYPNADAGGHAIIRMADRFAFRHPGQVRVLPSLGQQRYLSLLHQVSAVVGNSSSGIVEAPSIPVPAVDIGNRQQGRIAAASVIHTGLDKQAIIRGINKALSADFATFIRKVKNPYSRLDAAGHILKTLLRFRELEDIQKSFYDK